MNASLGTATPNPQRRRPLTGNLLASSLTFLSVAAVAWILFKGYSLKLWSDPQQWYYFGRHFPERFATARIAYGFPLVLYLAIHLIGPLWAMLVNVPLLLLLAYCLARFSAALFHNSNLPPIKLLPATCILLLMLVDHKMLLYLVSPYRDPLAFVLMLGSLILYLRGLQQPDSRLTGFVGGVLLALAVSTRETSILVVPAMLLAAATCARPHNIRSLAGWAAWWTLGAAVAFLPYLYQNTLTSGYPWIPVQAARTLDTEFSLTPGVSPRFLSDTLPRTAKYLQSHYSWAGLLAILAGGILLLRHNRSGLLFVLIAGLTYLLFYGSYVRPISRYLAVLDLFLLPLMAAGLLWAMHGAFLLAARRAPALARLSLPVTAAALACGLVISVLNLSGQYSSPRSRFRLADVRRFQQLLEHYLPSDATLVSGRYFGEAAMCTLANPVIIPEFIAPHGAYWHPHFPQLLAAYLHNKKSVFAAITSADLAELLAEEYDLQPVATLDLETEGWPIPIETGRVDIVRLLPWSNTVITAEITNAAPRSFLKVDLGRLSRFPRKSLQLDLNGSTLDHNPSDYVNFYRLSVPDDLIQLKVKSDAPLPARVDATANPFPLTLPVAFHNLRKLQSVLPLTVSRYAQYKYAAICDGARLRLPALMTTNEYLLASLQIGTPSWMRPLHPRLTLRAGFLPVLCRDTTERLTGGDPWTEFLLIIPPHLQGESSGRHITLHCSLETSSPPASDKPPCVFLRQIALLPAVSSPELVDIGSEDDNFWLIRGFHDREYGRERKPIRNWRWTTGQAEVLVLTEAPGVGVALSVHVLPDVRPDPVSPAFYFNGLPLSPSEHTEETGSSTVDYRLVVPPDMVTGRVNRLTLSCPVWSPAETLGSPDKRKLGIAVDRIHIRQLRTR